MTNDPLHEIRTWLQQRTATKGALPAPKKAVAGLRVLFSGPAGTGKTMAAEVLAKESGHTVVRVDLSRLTSKYIGETEKHLAQIFDQAQHDGSILFFDEADALFGKRTEVRDAHDRYANQEVSYLLQRIEGYTGLVILATKLPPSIGHPLRERMQVVIPFPIPGAK